MSERSVRLAWGALLCVACLLTARTAAAQMSAAELGTRIDSLALELEHRTDVVRRLDSLRQARAQRIVTDTARVGPFLVVERRAAEVARIAEAIGNEWREYTALVGLAAERIDGTIVMRTLSDGFAGLDPGTRMYRIDPHVTGEVDYARAADIVIRNALTDALPADLRDWLGGEWLRTSGGLDWSYRALATAHSRAAHGCFRDDVPSCVAALGLVDPGADWSGWYTPEQLRDRVANRNQLSPRITRCLGARNHTACVEELRDRGGAPPPLGPPVRGTLLAHAIRLGGTGAYERLFVAAPDVAARLAHAAGRPLDEVVASWRAAVQDERPDMHAGMMRAGFWTVVWLAGLALLAMRSTRWRLG